MFQVTLSAIAHGTAGRVERVVHKHSGGALDHAARTALVAKVEAGQPQVVARYHEAPCADRVVAELALLGAQATSAKAEGT